jgi:hypothetical protein
MGRAVVARSLITKRIPVVHFASIIWAVDETSRDFMEAIHLQKCAKM